MEQGTHSQCIKDIFYFEVISALRSLLCVISPNIFNIFVSVFREHREHTSASDWWAPNVVHINKFSCFPPQKLSSNISWTRWILYTFIPHCGHNRNVELLFRSWEQFVKISPEKVIKYLSITENEFSAFWLFRSHISNLMLFHSDFSICFHFFVVAKKSRERNWWYPLFSPSGSILICTYLSPPIDKIGKCFELINSWERKTVKFC